MPQVLVWKCPNTGKLFEDQFLYKQHLSKLANARRDVKKQNYIKNSYFEWLDDQRTNHVNSIDDIPAWLISNQQIIMDAANAIGTYRSFNEKFYDSDLFTSVDVYSVLWKSHLSNSHSCPPGGVTNWGGRALYADGKPKPTGYPGWSIMIKGSLQRNKKHRNDYPAGQLFRAVDIYTGTGGGGNESFGWDGKIWAEQWPAAASKIVFDKLAGQLV